MKKTALALWLFSVLIFASCAFYWDGELAGPPYTARVVFNVQPVDAQVLLDGRFIGEVFEFSTPETALRLRSRNHEIIIKKKGYIEEAVDLQKFMSRDITIELTLKEDQLITAEPAGEETPTEEQKPEYVAKAAPVKEPVTVSESEQPVVARMVEINFEILPADAAIYLNGKFWGLSPEGGKILNQYLTTGTYTIDVVKPEYKSARKVIELKDQKRLTVTITLEKAAREETEAQ